MRRPVPRSFSIVVLVSLGAVVFAACQVNGEITGQFTCVDSPACPAGMSCSSGVCVQSGGGDGGVEPPQACSTIDQIATAFDGNAIPSWADTYFQAGGTASVTNGDLVMSIPANMSKSRAQISTWAQYDLRGKTLELEVPKAGGETTEVGLYDASGGELWFGMTNGEIFVHSKGRFIPGSKQPYNAAKHRWWRVRTDGPNAIWETSADRTTWDAWATDTAPVDFAWIRVELSLQGRETNQTADTARWGSVNLGADATISWCPMSSWNESLTDNVLSPHSNYYGDNCTIVESNGTLKVSATARPTYCVVYSNRPIDATGATYSFPVEAAPEPGWTRIALADKLDRNIVSMYADAELHFYVEANDQTLLDGSMPFNRQTERYWRIALQGTKVAFETSPDGMTWTTRQSILAPSLDPTAMFMERTVYTDASGNNNFPTTATFGARIR